MDRFPIYSPMTSNLNQLYSSNEPTNADSLTLSDHQVDDLFRQNNVGIPVDHAIKMQSVARDTNTVFGIRPVESIVRTLIDEGYHTKGFSVKGKSSNWGPQAGFICENQRFSKREDRSEDDIKELNKAVQQGRKAGAYSVTALEISQYRLDELEKDFGLITIEDIVESKSSRKLSITAKSVSGENYGFEAVSEGYAPTPSARKYSICESETSQPIQVLAHPITEQPLTADYDLFLTAPSIEEHNSYGMDVRPNTAVSYNALPNDTMSQSEFYAREDDAMGNISPRVQNLVERLNYTLGRGDHLDMFHHNDDVGSPASNMRDNFPATFYLPAPLKAVVNYKTLEFSEICVIKNLEEFNEFVVCIKDNGYHFTSNPSWDTPNSSKFEASRNLFMYPKY